MSDALPFQAPATAVLPDESIPAALPEEAHYRPKKRRAWTWLIAVLTGAAAVGVVLVPRFGPLLAPAAAIALVVLIIRQLRSVPRLVKRNDEATALLAAGRVTEAAEEFEALTREGRSVPLLHALFVFNRAVTYHQAGQLEKALSLLAAVVHSGWSRANQIPNFHGLLLAEAATCLALLGDLAAADRLARRAHEHIGEPQRGRVMVAEVVILLRSGKAKAAAEHIREHYFSAEGTVGARGARAVRLLWAFALSGLPADQAAGIDLERLLAGTYPHAQDEFDHLIVRWPELARFVAERLELRPR